MGPKVRSLRRWYETNMPIPQLGVAIGAALFLAVRLLCPHPGEACGTLGQITEEWEIGMPATPLMCVATLAGTLRYGHMIVREGSAGE